MAPMKLFFECLVASVWLAQSSQCNGDSCPARQDEDETESLKVSLLQKRGEGTRDQSFTQTMKKLEDRKAAVLAELAEVEQELRKVESAESMALTGDYEKLQGGHKIPVNEGTEIDGGKGVYGANACGAKCSETDGCLWYVVCGSDCHLKSVELGDTVETKYNNYCDAYVPREKGSCAKYTCDDKYVPSNQCQCTKQCKDFNNCCDDYEAECASSRPTPKPRPRPRPRPADGGGSVEGVYGHPSASIDYPKYEGFTLYLAEEFEEPLDLDNDPIWTWSDGGLREGSVRFVKEQVKFEDGKMKIEASETKPFPATQSCSHASVEHIPYKPRISGELRSRYNIFRYGRYEARIKAPEVQPGKPWVNGNFIATMFVYRDANAHHWREIDFEITGDSTKSLTTNLLYADGTKDWKPYLQDSRQPDIGNVNVRADFNTYMFEWTPAGVIWYVNGREVRRGSRLNTPELSCKVMMNLWLFNGGGFGGHEGHNNRYPMTVQYEYFRFYKWDQETKYPCDGFSPDCLEEDDHYLAANNPCDGIEQKGLLMGQRPCYADASKCPASLSTAAAPAVTDMGLNNTS